jgi:hypothetical protein
MISALSLVVAILGRLRRAVHGTVNIQWQIQTAANLIYGKAWVTASPRADRHARSPQRDKRRQESWKRSGRRKFVWPPIVDGGMLLTPAQLALLVEAIDWRRTVAPKPVPRPLSV